MNSSARATAMRTNLGTISFWIGVTLAAFGGLSTVMSLALFEGSERYEAAIGWAVFGMAAFVVGRVVRGLLSR